MSRSNAAHRAGKIVAAAMHRDDHVRVENLARPNGNITGFAAVYS
jgi:hypothetical protein